MNKIVIIGSGMSGITSMRWAKEGGFDILCLEKNEDIGGCWFDKTYKNIKL